MANNSNAKRRPTESVRAIPPKKRRRRRGPLVRFRFGMVLFIWIACLIGSFAIYMIGRNLNPMLSEEEMSALSSLDDSSALESNSAEDSTPEDSVSTPTVTDDSSTPEESSQVVIPTKVNPVPEGELHSADYINHCAFLGDANIYRFGQMGLLQEKCYYSSENLTLDNYETEDIVFEGARDKKMLSKIRAASCPIYLLFGTESLSTKTPLEASEQFHEMLNKVRAAAPEAEIFVLSIPPVTAAAETGEGHILNSDIDAYNSLLLEIANQENVYFVDTNTALKNNESKLDADKAQEDGIHLTAEGGQVLLNYVLCHVPK